MIVANIATYPPRKKALAAVIARVAPQLDRINVVLNEYKEVPPEIGDFKNVVPIIPDEDTKDTGKFYPKTEAEDWIFLLDDDLILPKDFVSATLEKANAVAESGALFGYHGSVYRKPPMGLTPKRLKSRREFSQAKVQSYRKNYIFYKKLKHPLLVDQVATNLALIRGSDLPSFEYMRGSQKFVDVRLAKWCFENGIRPICLARDEGWIEPVRFEETIFDSFTNKEHSHVAEEIWSYAFKRPGVGKKVGLRKPG